MGVWYREEMVLLFHAYGCLVFITSEETIDGVYATLQAYFNIEDNVKLKKYLVIELDL